MKRKHRAKEGRTVEEIDFEKAEVEKLKLVKRHMDLKTNREVIKTLIFQKFDEIKLKKENLAKQRIAEEKAISYLENFTCPLFK